MTDLPAVGSTATMTTKHGTIRIRITNNQPDPQRQPGHILGNVIGGTDNRARYAEPVLLPLGNLVVDEQGLMPEDAR